MKHYVFHPEADQEYAEAASYYAQLMNLFRKPLILLLLIAGLVLTYGCASAHKARPVIPTVELTGTSNAPVVGYYIVQGKRVELNGVLPLTISLPGLSQLAVRKFNSEQVLTVTATAQNGSACQTVPAKLDQGIRVLLEDLSVSSIPPQESLAPVQGERIVIAPYWDGDTWVFDDPTHGLRHEAFVKGTPEMLTPLVKDLPTAHEGFWLTCSTKGFKGYQKKLVWVRAEAGGNYYRFADQASKSTPGWLGPAMYRYFTKTPKALYLKADAKKG